MTDDLKTRLLKSRITEDDVEIPGVGTVRVRGLSRGEVLAVSAASDNPGKLERKIVALGMVDPALTESEIEEWQNNSPANELEAVVDKINELSGLGQGAQKSDVPGVRDET